MNGQVVFLVVALSVLGGCQRKAEDASPSAPAAQEGAAATGGAKPTAAQCEQAAAKLIELARLQAEASDDEEQAQLLAALPQIGEVFQSECVATAWSPAAIACIMAASTVADGEKCSALLPPPSSDEPVEIRMGQGDEGGASQAGAGQ